MHLEHCVLSAMGKKKKALTGVLSPEGIAVYVGRE